MASVTHTSLRHGTRLAFENDRLTEVTGPAGDVQVTLAWDAGSFVGLEVPPLPGVRSAILVRGERVPHVLFGSAHPVMVGGTAVTWMGAIDWARPTLVPPIEHPARIPGGAGTTILNVLALLAREAGVTAVRYAGPYPTAALWQSLAQSFRSRGDEEAFTAGALERATRADMTPIEVELVPAPFERVTGAVTVQLRDEVERVTVRGETFAGADGVRRLVPSDGGGWAAEVWLGGAVWGRVAIVDAGGASSGGPWELPAVQGELVGQALPPPLKAALGGLVAEQIAAPLGALAREVMSAVHIEWGDAGAAAARDRRERVVVHAALWERLAPRGLAHVALALAEALAPIVATRAQAKLAELLAAGARG